ncbi:MAG TPA: biotin--[acetyl-CoA-carboxylase] ligase [Burkholderiaceae bacterium]|nr:biotin--[acetyl-CoA-carboxylase] ligase [Burkholderiaceae bacterium]
MSEHTPSLHRNVTMLLPATDMQATLPLYLPDFGQVTWVDRTISTNLDLYNQARQDDGHGPRPWLLGAHRQDAGRGRAGRTWHNAPGANLMFSCAFDVFLPPDRLPALSPLAGMVACEVLRRPLRTGNRPHLTMKWPNDIQWQSAKLAGILVEATRAGTLRKAADHHVIIIGIGINLQDARALSQSLQRRIADWSQVANADIYAASLSAVSMVADIAHAWRQAIGDISLHGLENLVSRFQAVDALAGKQVNITDQGKLLQQGVACGINAFGQLQLRNNQGVHSITVGDVSVRDRQWSHA